MKSFKQVVEEFVPKFQRATKTQVHYTGMINNKTWVVPHSFHGNHDVLHGTKVTPIRHSIVVSPTHVLHNNPTLTPEEAARVHSHIKDIHGGQDPSRLGNLDEDRQLALHLGMTKSDRPQPSKEVPAVKQAAAHYKKTHTLVPGTPEHQAERDKYRHAALVASRQAATLAFAKKRGIIKERTIGTGSLKFNKIANSKPITYNSFGKIVKEEKTMSTPPKEHVWNVTDHAGNKHEVEAKDRGEAMKKTVSVGGIHPQGIAGKEKLRDKATNKRLGHLFAKGMATSKRLSEDAEQLNETFMGTYTRNENANRHTANIVHLAKHFGDTADQAQAKFYADELKKHGHNIHHEAQYKLHEKLWPKAAAAHHQGMVKEENKMITPEDEFKRRGGVPNRAQWRADFKKSIAGIPTKTKEQWAAAVKKSKGIKEESLNELKVPKVPFLQRHMLGANLRDTVSRVHDMKHHELKSLHQHYEKHPAQSVIQAQQHRSIKKALRKYGDPQGTHTPLDKSKFVKKDLKEHSDTLKIVKRVLGGE